MSTIHEDLIRDLQVKQAEKVVQEASSNRPPSWVGWGGLCALLAVLWKMKALIVLGLAKLKFFALGAKALSFGKMLTTGGTMLISIALYAQLWGLPYAVGFVLLIFVHEMGHVIAIRGYGISASTPVFVPFVGAFVALKEMPRNAWVEAVVGIAGPLFGGVAALACYLVWQATGSPIWLALAYSGFMLNLFNLLPVLPLDGGRVAAAVSPRLWLLGTVAAAACLLWWSNFLLLIVLALGLPRALAFFRGEDANADYYAIPTARRLAMGVAFFGLAALLGIAMLETHYMLEGSLR